MPPLSAEVRQRIEDQRDWEDAQAQWEQMDVVMKAAKKAGSKVVNSETYQKMQQKAEQMMENVEVKKE